MMLKKEEFINLMSLKSVNGLGNKRAILLLKHFRDSSLVFSSKATAFKPFNFITEDTLRALSQALKKSEEFEAIYKYCTENKINIISYFDDTYPTKLRNITNPPLVLFLKGDIGLLSSKPVAVVGSRMSSESALKYGFALSKELSEKGYVIVSGGAKGIDSAAHRGSLECSGKTICVLPCGFDNLYPKENFELFGAIEKKGLLISEYLPKSNVDRFSLLERNRITSGISDSVFIVSASANGGAMSQFKCAYSQKKPVFCPAPESELKPFDGIFTLINERRIMPVRNADEFLAKITGLKKKHVFQVTLAQAKPSGRDSHKLVTA